MCEIGVVLTSWLLLFCCTVTKYWYKKVVHMLQANCSMSNVQAGQSVTDWAFMGPISTGKYHRPRGCDMS